MTSQAPMDRLRSQVATLRAATEDAGTSCFAVLARSLGGGHVGDRRVDLAA